MTGYFASQGHGKTPALLWKLSLRFLLLPSRKLQYAFLTAVNDRHWSTLAFCVLPLLPLYTAKYWDSLLLLCKVQTLLNPALWLRNTVGFWWLLNCSVPQQDAFLVCCWDFQKQVVLNIENLDIFLFTLMNRLVAPLFGSGLVRLLMSEESVHLQLLQCRSTDSDIAFSGKCQKFGLFVHRGFSFFLSPFIFVFKIYSVYVLVKVLPTKCIQLQKHPQRNTPLNSPPEHPVHCCTSCWKKISKTTFQLWMKAHLRFSLHPSVKDRVLAAPPTQPMTLHPSSLQ